MENLSHEEVLLISGGNAYTSGAAIGDAIGYGIGKGVIMAGAVGTLAMLAIGAIYLSS